ncbi:MAG: ribonuclease H-like domain-containing protein [Piptocephalis tieghemiana]|nr:MAG: ribonuclease H-like domain-containing protein [Piptocephalis tieghemiana]
MTKDFLTIYTDASVMSHETKGSCGGVGVFFADNDVRNTSKALEGHGWHSVDAEIKAITVALGRIGQWYKGPLRVMTDCMAIVTVVNSNRLERYSDEGGTKSPWRSLKNAIDGYKGLVRMKYVHGHKGVKGNVEADRLARQGAKEAKEKASQKDGSSGENGKKGEENESSSS